MAERPKSPLRAYAGKNLNRDRSIMDNHENLKPRELPGNEGGLDPVDVLGFLPTGRAMKMLGALKGKKHECSC